MMPLFYDECQVCQAIEERVFVDSWTGLEVCLPCLGPIVDHITNSPCSEKDNLAELLDYEEEDD